MAIYTRKSIVIQPFMSSDSEVPGNWSLVIKREGLDTLKFALHWGDKEIPAHVADESFTEFCQKVTAL